MSRVCKIHQRLEKKRQNENTMLLKVRDKFLDKVKISKYLKIIQINNTLLNYFKAHLKDE